MKGLSRLYYEFHALYGLRSVSAKKQKLRTHRQLVRTEEQYSSSLRPHTLVVYGHTVR